jgi:hypothetical protein
MGKASLNHKNAEFVMHERAYEGMNTRFWFNLRQVIAKVKVGI